MYEHYCVLCSARKMTPKLCLAVTNRGKKNPIALMLENYCRRNVTTENVPQLHLCLLHEELKLEAIVSKVDNFREKWMGKDNINRQQPFRVKRTLSGADFEQQSDKKTPATKTRKELNFSTTSLSGKPLLKLILQLLKKRLF